MKQLLFASSDSWTGLVLRLTIGAIMFPHGAQKMLGAFGGYGFRNTMAYFTGTMKLPWLIGFLVISSEFIGSIGLLLGCGSRLWALSFIAIMMGAIITINFRNGLFMNWFGDQKGEGYEYHSLVIGISLALLLTGSGKFSCDSLFI